MDYASVRREGTLWVKWSLFKPLERRAQGCAGRIANYCQGSAFGRYDGSDHDPRNIGDCVACLLRGELVDFS
jgi:hypothetical protein